MQYDEVLFVFVMVKQQGPKATNFWLHVGPHMQGLSAALAWEFCGSSPRFSRCHLFMFFFAN